MKLDPETSVLNPLLRSAHPPQRPALETARRRWKVSGPWRRRATPEWFLRALEFLALTILFAGIYAVFILVGAVAS